MWRGLRQILLEVDLLASDQQSTKAVLGCTDVLNPNDLGYLPSSLSPTEVNQVAGGYEFQKFRGYPFQAGLRETNQNTAILGVRF